MAKSKLLNMNQNIERKVVGSYKKIEKGVVDTYTKIEDKFVDTYLTHDNETVDEAKERLQKEHTLKESENTSYEKK